jgi:N-6 DNA Methylase
VTRASSDALDALLAAIQTGISLAAGSGRPEAVLREHVEPALSEALVERGVRAHRRAEVRLAVPAETEASELDAPLTTSGRADAVYNRFVIEFEPPASLRPSVMHSATRHAVAQVQQYLRGLSEHLGISLDRLAGCAFDGSWIVYITHDGGEWHVLRPRQADRDSLAALVDALVSLASGRGLTAENLFDDFGPESEAARAVVPAFVQALSSPDLPLRARTFYEQWRLDVGHAAGLPASIDLPDWLELCETLGIPRERASRPDVLFALQTYFGIIAKLVSLVVLQGATGDDLLGGLSKAGDVWDGFDALEEGLLTASTGALNAVEPGIFSWYLASRSDALGEALRRTAAVAEEYSAEVVEITPLAARDVLKELFQKLLPTRLRHRLGEYYTPDWLADFVLDEVGYDGDPNAKLLDPACGSGTFLVLAIARLRQRLEDPTAAERPTKVEVLERVLRNISGFDVSPLAVMAARANYLIAIRDLLPQASGIEIPVYLCDSVVAPSEHGRLVAPGQTQPVELHTGAGTFYVPAEIAQDRHTMTVYSTLLASWAAAGRSEENFIAAVRDLGVPATDEEAHKRLYNQVRTLEVAGANGIWANIIRNSFAPLLQERVDFVVGNPPWVAWNTLPTRYRDRVRDIMVGVYALSSPDSSMRRLGSAKKDLSSLFVYVALDRFLRDGGRLGFVITQTLFQSTAADEFRKFQLPDGTDVKIKTVDDWVEVAPFSSATNKTATFVATKGEETEYPVPYRIWRPSQPFDRDRATLDEVKRSTTNSQSWAHLSDARRKTSLWVITSSSRALGSTAGAERYRPREGVSTALEAAFRVSVIRALAEVATVRNIRDRAKRPLPEVTADVELARIHPYVTGSSIAKWQVWAPGNYLVPHTATSGMQPIGQPELQRYWPLTFAYFEQFKAELETRSIHLRWGRENPFYSMYNIGPYTFAPWKVVWKRTTRDFEAAVVSELPVTDDRSAVVVPNNKVMMIGLDDSLEAHYVCGVLNSSLSRARINASISSEAHGEILALVTLPAYAATDLQTEIADASLVCHSSASVEDEHVLSEAESELDALVAQLWGIGEADLREAQLSLRTKASRRKRLPSASE